MVKPLIIHPDTATTPALAACAAGQQGKFFEFTRAVWDAAWDTAGDSPRFKGPDNLKMENMEKIATSLQLDLAKFKADVTGDKCKQNLQENAGLLRKFGVNGTPGFFINGRFIGGYVPIDRFKAVVEEELKKADVAIKSQGVRPEDYYKSVVVDKGKKSL